MLVLAGEAAIGSLLNPVRNTTPEKVRSERLRRRGPKHFTIANAQVRDAHVGQSIQLDLDGWIDLSGF